ncbi:hypothetical protein An02g02645 [Aspergillus niger]|uniref:Uncharacterized protein n=2 Tax=Aspergillus niger TaxID=5061 RepID=A2QC85_ASPNC|nr:hypothetical protein An02g02645 [Aspergillus niger]CAK37545.1 hypothetical protein An02g02645 [Aspergillus niger]
MRMMTEESVSQSAWISMLYQFRMISHLRFLRGGERAVTGATSKPSLSARARQQSTPSPACVCSSDFVGSPNAALTFLIPSFPLRKRKKGRQKDLRYRYLSVPSVQTLSAPQCLIACLIASYLSVRARPTRLTPIQRVRYLFISSSVIGYTRLGSFALSLA